MPCLRFFCLIEYSLKIDSSDYKHLTNIISFPYMDSSRAREFLRDIDSLGEPPQPISKEEIKKDRERLREVLSGKVL